MSLAARRGLLAVLSEHGVRFVVIGGMAVIAHGHIRATKDVDIVFDTAEENCSRFVGALKELRAEVLASDTLPRAGEITASWLGEGDQFVFATEQGMLDALARTSVGGYDDLAPRAIETSMRDGSTFKGVSYDDLVRSKEAAGREQDMLDLKALREVRGEV